MNKGNKGGEEQEQSDATVKSEKYFTFSRARLVTETDADPNRDLYDGELSEEQPTDDEDAAQASSAKAEKLRELIVRWYQFGLFSPVFRTHGCRAGPSLSLVSVGVWPRASVGRSALSRQALVPMFRTVVSASVRLLCDRSASNSAAQSVRRWSTAAHTS